MRYPRTEQVPGLWLEYGRKEIDPGDESPPWSLNWNGPDLMLLFERYPTRTIYVDTGQGTAKTCLKWSEARRLALARDGHRCRVCGADDRDALTVHHIYPKGLGGVNCPANLVTLCRQCHQDLCRRCRRSADKRVALGLAAFAAFTNSNETGKKSPCEVSGSV